MIPVEDAVEKLLERVVPQQTAQRLPLLDCLGRVLAEDVSALMDQPPFNRSPLDGFAVNHEDLIGACPEKPAVLSVAQTIFAGDTPKGELKLGEAARVMTGAPLPDGATCVVRQEDTDQGRETVRIFVSHKAYENYCFRGEDVRAGRALMHTGERLDCARLGLLAGQGKTHASVFLRPKACIFSTGSELAAPGVPLPNGKIYDSNSVILSARAMEVGADVRKCVSTADEPEALAAALQENLDAGLIITTGSVSVGAHDYMPLVGEMIGAERLFHRIAAKPGSPALALEKDGTLILCLSGNPFAAFATFELLAVPVLRKMAGEKNILHKKTSAMLLEEFNKPSKNRRFLRARIEGGDVFFPGKGHASGVLSSLMDCNCLIDIPAGTPKLKKGAVVDTILL